jgi:hypothetical protein
MDDPPRLSLDDLQSLTRQPEISPEPGRGSMQQSGRIFWTRSRKEAIAAWLFILPDFVGLLIFVAIPMVLALSWGFSVWTGLVGINSSAWPITTGCFAIRCS